MTSSPDREARGPGACSSLEVRIARHRSRLRRIVAIRLGAELRRILSTAARRALTAPADPDCADATVPDTLLGLERVVLAWMRCEESVPAHLRAVRSGPADSSSTTSIGPGEDSHPGIDPRVVGGTMRTRHEVFDACLELLAPDQREVVLLRDYHGGTWDWIARVSGGSSPESMRVRYLHARVRLTEILQRRLAPRASA